MKYKFDINYLNYHFQKGIVVLVATMLLTIPNMKVYSSIGSYQTSSKAITVNNSYHDHSLNPLKDRPFFLLSICGSSLIDVALVGYFVAALVVNLGSVDTRFPNENYAKYDFSQFDN